MSPSLPLPLTVAASLEVGESIGAFDAMGETVLGLLTRELQARLAALALPVEASDLLKLPLVSADTTSCLLASLVGVMVGSNEL